MQVLDSSSISCALSSGVSASEAPGLGVRVSRIPATFTFGI